MNVLSTGMYVHSMQAWCPLRPGGGLEKACYKKLRHFIIKQWWLFPAYSSLQIKEPSRGTSATATLWSPLRWESYEVISS